MMTKVLYDGGWFSHHVTEQGIEFIAENHDGVTCLCYDPSRKDGRPFLLLHEQMSATMTSHPRLCSLTGSIDPGEDPLQTCLRELREEAGAVVLENMVTYHGPVYTYKGCTKVTHAFSANLQGCGFAEAIGDGSEVEERAYVRWHSLQDLLKTEDALLLATLAMVKFDRGIK